MKNFSVIVGTICVILLSCGKDNGTVTPPLTPATIFQVKSQQLNGNSAGNNYTNVNLTPIIKFTFSGPVNTNTVAANVLVNEGGGAAASFVTASENNDSTLVVKPNSLKGLTRYNITVATGLQSKQNIGLQSPATLSFITGIDSSRKFPAITDDALMTLAQQQTFKYFWDFGHPTSGLARERNTDGDLVTSGGSGFGIMTIPVGINRNFITRAQGLARIQTTVAFLKNTAQKFHGAFPHWLNGNTGAVIPFSTKDNGADLVETAYLIQGLLTARQYFNGVDAAETALRNSIDTIWRRVEWNWFRKGSENVLYWHWSPDYNWDMNVQIKGWNECLITYILAASSPTYSIPKVVYDNGWASNGGMANGNTYFGVQLPLGPTRGGPLFFTQYSFLGMNPNGLSDAYANYFTQNRAHTLINYNYCVSNPLVNSGYSDSCWGLTASDIANGYTASSPTNDVGVIAPTAALSSFPYTPTESMKALKFFYYVLGDKLWKQYGFVDAFSIKDLWFADSFLAIDQGPIIIMIENYRTQLLWNLFTSATEVKTGMRNLGFSAPYL